MMNSHTQNRTDLVDLSPRGQAKVMVHPEDYDAFIVSQREAVEAIRDRHQMLSMMENFKRQIDDLLVDIAGWSKHHNVAKAILSPRIDDALIVFVARDEDVNGELHDQMSALELELDEKYNFRLSFLLFRASEEYGLDSFIDTRMARIIYQCRSNPPT